MDKLKELSEIIKHAQVFTKTNFETSVDKSTECIEIGKNGISICVNETSNPEKTVYIVCQAMYTHGTRDCPPDMDYKDLENFYNPYLATAFALTKCAELDLNNWVDKEHDDQLVKELEEAEQFAAELNEKY